MLISFGGSEREYIQIDVVGYEHQPAGESSGDNWLVVRISVSAGGFRGAADASFLAEDFAALLPQLQSLNESSRGAAQFATMEEQLRLKFTGGGTGPIELEGELLDRPEFGNRLIFRIDLDRPHLRQAIDQLEQVVSAFPVRKR